MRLRQDSGQERDVAFGIEALKLALPEQAAWEELDQAENLVALAATTGFDGRLLALAALVFWSPGFLFTWLFDGIFQMARYPVGIYPGWLRLVLTWVIPVGLMTTVPAQALTGDLAAPWLLGSAGLAVLLLFAASLLFRAGLRHYASASS